MKESFMAGFTGGMNKEAKKGKSVAAIFAKAKAAGTVKPEAKTQPKWWEGVEGQKKAASFDDVVAKLGMPPVVEKTAEAASSEAVPSWISKVSAAVEGEEKEGKKEEKKEDKKKEEEGEKKEAEALPSWVEKIAAKKKSMAVGGGGRFEMLKRKIAARGDVRDPGAVAAAIGRAKYGKKRFQEMAAKG